MHVEAADIAAMRAEEGGLTSFIAALTARSTASSTPAPPVTGSAHGPGHRPGSWPAGTRTDRETCHADCACSLHPSRLRAVPHAA